MNVGVQREIRRVYEFFELHPLRNVFFQETCLKTYCP